MVFMACNWLAGYVHFGNNITEPVNQLQYINILMVRIVLIPVLFYITLTLHMITYHSYTHTK